MLCEQGTQFSRSSAWLWSSPHCIWVITSSTCAARQAAPWQCSLTPSAALFISLPSSPHLFLCPVISARTRYRGFQGKRSEEPWRSRTCKWHFGDTFSVCVFVCTVSVGACTSVTCVSTVFANAHSPLVPAHQYFIVLNVRCLPLAVLTGTAAR